MDRVQPPTALSVAGSDSGGGAGVQADIRTFNAFRVHATTALTAATAQNTLGVREVYPLTPEMVAAQVRAVADDFRVAASKTGMLATATIVECVAALADEGLLPRLVVDPVLVSTSGDLLMAEGGVRAYREALFSFAHVVTPNLREAAVLCDVPVDDIRTVDDLTRLAHDLLAMGPTYVVVKGGHLSHSLGTGSPDVVVSRDECVILHAPRVVTSNDHGTGCSLSAAIAAGLALGREPLDAVRDAKNFVHDALARSATWHLGAGRGPIDHLGWGE